MQVQKWLSLAALGGVADAKGALEKLEATLSAEQLAEGKRLAAEWRQSRPEAAMSQ